MKAAFYTLGCKVNQYESRVIGQAFTEYGYEIVPFGETCDVAVINSCAVTEESARKSRQIIRRAKRLNPGVVVAVVGCLVQVCADTLYDADVLVGSGGKRRLPEYVGEFLQTGRRVVAVGDTETDFEPMQLTCDEHTRATVKVQDGCNNFCSYCIIPYARGRIRSKPIESAVAEITALAGKGYKEIVLTGIHLDSYGKERGEYGLCELINQVNRIDGVERIRLGSLEPTFITDENISSIRQADKLCPHFHLSLQSGCTKTLRAMNRHYSAEQYLQAVQALRGAYGDVSVTTDVIVGFPGETDSDFTESLEFVRAIGFSKVHVFPFSPRRGTRAYVLAGQVPSQIKKERCTRMLQAAGLARQSFLQDQCGKICEVLFEHEKDGLYVGYTAGYAEVRAASETDLKNKIVPVRITRAVGDFCIGDLQKS